MKNLLLLVVVAIMLSGCIEVESPSDDKNICDEILDRDPDCDDLRFINTDGAHVYSYICDDGEQLRYQLIPTHHEFRKVSNEQPR